MSTNSQFAANPPECSSRLQRLFPPGIVVTEMRGPGDPATLHPDEARLMGRSAPKRVRDFAAGRSCARLALAAFGIRDFALRVAADRQPVWPDALVGSISHTEDLCVAAVGRREQFLSVGIDCEVVGQVTAELLPTILTTEEATWVDSLPTAQQASASALIFSGKEAFYKCQFPLTAEWLDFADLEIQPVDVSLQYANFLVVPTRPIAVTGKLSHPAASRYAFGDGFVTTGVVFERLPALQ